MMRGAVSVPTTIVCFVTSVSRFIRRLNYYCEQIILNLKFPPPPKSSLISKIGVRKKRGGYVKPGKLLYRDEGTLRDKLIFEVREYLEGFGYVTKSTKCLHSFVRQDKKFLLKVDTRRKNSILLYIREDLSDLLMEKGFRCRSLFDSEKPNFPAYLRWVAVVKGESDIRNFMSAFAELRGVENDTK